MFGFLKDKIKNAVEKFSSKAEKLEVTDEDFQKDEVIEKLEEENHEEPEEKKGFFKKIFSKKEEIPEVTPVVEEKTPHKEIEILQKEEISTEEEDENSEEHDEAVEEILEKEVEISKPEVPVEEEIKEPTMVPEAIEARSSEATGAQKSETSSEKELIPEKKKEVEEIVREEEIIDTTQKKKGFFSKIKETFVKFKLTDENFEELFWDFELGLLESNVALEVIEKIKIDLKEKLTSENVTKKSIPEVILKTLKETFDEILSVESFDLIKKIKSKGEKPFIISMIGVNGSGKTTTLAKIVKLLQNNNLSLVVAASDTFRAAAIHQLEDHTNKLGVKLIKHDYNADAAAVAFDAIKHAQAKNLDVVLIDTAGRLHSNTNLMDELKKVIRISEPDLKIFVGESITGNDCVEQATEFNKLIGIDAIILSKADVDDNGGAAISVSYVTKKPILFLGTGQTYDDLIKFDKKLILDQLGF